ncbi:MAG: HAD hydrolase-like protein [Lentisphaerae bacterium]|nr:HAD hydrolase-like protein [Lentisphaerota bacterium]
MKQRIIMFDFDGVIADSFDVFYQALVRTLREFGHTCVRNPVDFRALFDDNACRSLEALRVPPEDLNEILAEVGRKLESRLDDMPLFPGVADAIRALRQTCVLYIITSNDSHTVSAYLERVGLRDCFQCILGANDHPSKVEKIRQVRRRHPRQSFVYVGDTVGDLREARRARVSRAAAAWGWHDAEHLRQHDPDYFLARPDELRRLEQQP